MAITKTPFLIIVITFASVIGVAALISSNPAIFGGLVQVRSGNVASEEGIDILIGELASGDRIGLAFPPKTIYTAGDSFTPSLGIMNNLDSESVFYLEIVQDSGPEGGPVISHARDSGSLMPGESRVADISIISSPQTPRGIYGYAILVCTSQPCDAQSTGLYSSTHMSFRIV
jgi:hypothetical protein